MSEPLLANGESKDRVVAFHTSQGLKLEGGLLRLSPHSVAFEVYSAHSVLRTSEVLKEFKIFARGRTVYSGRAVVRVLVDAGTVQVCEANLDGSGFDADFFLLVAQPEKLRERFAEFFQEWQKVCQVLPEFKVALADIETFLMDLRRWSEQVELGISGTTETERMEKEQEAIEKLSPQMVSIIDELFVKFEEVAKSLDREAQPVHRSYAQRLLHPIVLRAPFAARAYHKPLGYAGDYEMVNMMLRDPKEGESLFARIFNVWLLQQDSAAAHRNRIEFLRQRLVQESLRCMRHQRPMRVLNLGCGPAGEIQKFLAEGAIADPVQFTLLDFNDETVHYTTRILGELKRRHGRHTEILVEKKSVHRVIKDGSKAMPDLAERGFDFVCCSGLFDYLSDRTCRQLMNIFWSWTRPGGLVLATNVTPVSPNRGSLEMVLDWSLNYRTTAEFRNVAPDEAPRDDTRIYGDDTGVNIFLEARKPDA
jgi:extracellular factor (EF) 3-hydroxypalmitic acid methyl ester biosynthesis protein